MPGKTESIFRAYDIRGIYGDTLNEDVMRGIGRAFSCLIEGETVVVARDGRLSGESLSQAFMDGVISAGKNIEYLGILPLGVAMFHAWKNKMTTVFVTASHLPGDWNGLKFFKASGLGFMEDDLNMIKDAFFGDIVKESGKGEIKKTDRNQVIDAYIKHLVSAIKPSRKMSITLDPGNGAAGVIVRKLFVGAGFIANVMYEEVDGNFPSRSPDPMSDMLEGLSRGLYGSDLGVAYDGDGDRMVVMDEQGTRLTPEQVSYIILSELLKDHPGPIVANVETTKTIDKIAERFKRHVHRVRVGHNYLMQAASDKGACFGMEPSGHYAVPSIFPFDDSLAISYYFACVLSRRSEPLSKLASEIPSLPFERLNLDVPDDRKFGVIENLTNEVVNHYPKTSTLDGIRVDLDNGWVLIRPSNTQPQIRLTIEARTPEDLESLREEFSGILKKYINP